MRSFLLNLLGLIFIGLVFGIGCGGLLLDAHQVDRAILHWTGR